MPSKLTHEEFIKRVAIARPDVEVLNQYTGLYDSVLIRCKKCGKTTKMLARTALTSQECSECSYRRRTMSHQDFVAKIKKLHPNIEIVGQFVRLTEKVHVRCIECGSEWDALPINLYSKGSHYCKTCADRRRTKPYEQFVEEVSALHPNLIVGSDYCGSGKAVTMTCSRCGYVWKPVASSISRGNGCPVCSGHRVMPGYNDILTTHPIHALSWDYSKNIDISPDSIQAGSDREVWWKCALGHEWKSTVSRMTHSQGDCPICSNRVLLSGFNDLATKVPSLLNYWDYDKNAPLEPSQLNYRSAKRVWWKCENGHSWQESVNKRVDGNGCPYCSGKRILKGFNDLETKHPDIAKEWAMDLNCGVAPSQVTAKSQKSVWWRCKYGHTWQTKIGNRTSLNSGCPICAESKGEKQIEKCLNKLNEPYEKQKTFDSLVGIRNGLLSYDFYLPRLRLLVEFNGHQHYGPVPYFGGKKTYEIQKIHDERKLSYAEQHGYEVLIIKYNQIDNISAILQSAIMRNSKAGD